MLPNIEAHHYKAVIAPQIKFGHQLTERDYTVTPNPDSEMNAYMASKTMRALQLRDLYKKQEDDGSHLKLDLNVLNGIPTSGEQALADNLLFLERPTDVLVDHEAGPASVPTLMMTRLYNGLLRDASGSGATQQGGKRFISRHASISLGPMSTIMGGDNKSIQIRREKFNEEFQMRAALIMLATGETDHDKVVEDLSSSQEFNALQSLAYGEHGLVDAILVGEDKVLTREGLNTFYRLKKFSPEQIAEFNEDNWNLDQIAEDPDYQELLVPLSKFSPGSVVPDNVLKNGNRPSPYLAFNAPEKKRVADKPTEKIVIASEPDSKPEPLKSTSEDSNDATSGTGKEPAKTIPSASKSDTNEELLVGVRSLDDTDFKVNKKSNFLDAPINEVSDKPLHIQIQGAKPSRGVLYDDTIFFNDGFDMETAEQITQGLRALKSKKLKQTDPSHVKIVINSPGGDVRAAEKLTNELDGMGNIKTDVIVNGMAASCGAWLLASATGNKLATPQARIMIHQPSINIIRGSTYKLGNQSADNINRLYKHLSGAISKGTGRDRELVEKDLNQDTWMNPLEALFYGSLKDDKGLLDGILVGSNQAITRHDVLDYLKTDSKVQAYLTQKFGTEDNVTKYLESRLQLLSKPKSQWKQPNTDDPFNDAVRTIMQVAARSARNIDQIDSLKGSATRPWTADTNRTIDQFIVGRRRILPADYWNSAPGEESEAELHPRDGAFMRGAPR